MNGSYPGPGEVPFVLYQQQVRTAAKLELRACSQAQKCSPHNAEEQKFSPSRMSQAVLFRMMSKPCFSGMYKAAHALDVGLRENAIATLVVSQSWMHMT